MAKNLVDDGEGDGLLHAEELDGVVALDILVSNLRHRNVVGCYGLVREPKTKADGTRPPPKLLQEFCPGGDLLDQIRKPRYDAAQAFTWLREIALGMACLHMTGGIHRDLKPENVLLRDGVAKVGDFGLFSLDPGDESVHRGSSGAPTRRPGRG